MIDIFDIFAFIVFAVLSLTVTAIVVALGSLPGWIARNRNHPQAAAVDQIILSIDGLQPEKRHETLYVVRELPQKRVWFAEPLAFWGVAVWPIFSTTYEITPTALIIRFGLIRTMIP